MSCFNCKFYTGSYYVACAVNPPVASLSPREGCREWEREEAAPAELPQAPQQAEPPQDFLFNILIVLFSIFVLGISITVAVNPAAVIRHAAPSVVRED